MYSITELKPSGLITYDRDFLMKLQKAKMSQEKPDALGNTTILQEIVSTRGSPMAIATGRRDFNPDYFKPTSVSFEPIYIVAHSVPGGFYSCFGSGF